MLLLLIFVGLTALSGLISIFLIRKQKCYKLKNFFNILHFCLFGICISIILAGVIVIFLNIGLENKMECLKAEIESDIYNENISFETLNKISEYNEYIEAAKYEMNIKLISDLAPKKIANLKPYDLDDFKIIYSPR